jgi:hypothetical protein
MIALMMEVARTSETSVDNYFTRQYIPEDKSEFILAAVRTLNLTQISISPSDFVREVYYRADDEGSSLL